MMLNNNFFDKTAIGIVTCDRPDFFKTCLNSIPPQSGKIFIMNAGTVSIDPTLSLGVATVIENTTNKRIPVGHAKNILIRKMREDPDNEYLFIVEDDIKIINYNVFEKYIQTAERTGLMGCLSYGGHGAGNRNSNGDAVVKETVKYDDDISIDLYHNSFAAFQLYHRNIFREIGFFDERFVNAAEHLDHYVKQYTAGIAPPFWFFPDIHESWKYIEDQDRNHSSSVIRNDLEFAKIFRNGWEEFKKKRGFYPTDIKEDTKENVLNYLTEIEKLYRK